MARVGLALYLALYLIAVGPVSGYVWARGGHATPEHWLYHMVLEQLGVADHHGPVEGLPLSADRPLSAIRTIAAGLHLDSPFVTAPAPTTFAPDPLLGLVLGLFPDLDPPAVDQRLALFDDPIPMSLSPEPPEQPPSFDR
jgi:hypothetical protein